MIRRPSPDSLHAKRLSGKHNAVNSIYSLFRVILHPRRLWVKVIPEKDYWSVDWMLSHTHMPSTHTHTHTHTRTNQSPHPQPTPGQWTRFKFLGVFCLEGAAVVFGFYEASFTPLACGGTKSLSDIKNIKNNKKILIYKKSSISQKYNSTR